eukprot:scaffold234984_cov40-Prasinocladus_malaysianus.AAC.1
MSSNVFTPVNVLAEIAGCSPAQVEAQPVKGRVSPCRGFDGLFTVTYTAAVKGRQPDDKIYAASPWMQEHVPRGFSAVVEKHAGEAFSLVTVMQGPRKFDGVSQADNDDAVEGDASSMSIFDMAKISQWQAANLLQI